MNQPFCISLEPQVTKRFSGLNSTTHLNMSDADSHRRSEPSMSGPDLDFFIEIEGELRVLHNKLWPIELTRKHNQIEIDENKILKKMPLAHLGRKICQFRREKDHNYKHNKDYFWNWYERSINEKLEESQQELGISKSYFVAQITIRNYLDIKSTT